MCSERAFLYRPLPSVLLIASPIPTAPPERWRVESCRSNPERSTSKQFHHQPVVHESLQRCGVGDGSSQQDGLDLALDLDRDQRSDHGYQECSQYCPTRQGKQVASRGRC